MKYLLVLMALVSCDKSKTKINPQDLLTENQKIYLSSSSLEVKAYMDSCLDDGYWNFNRCLERYKEMGAVQVEKNEGGSVLKTAAGVALGYGAVKMLTGK